jgi:hypothetical protein
MTGYSRRGLLAVSALATVSAVALAACTSGTPTASQLAADVNLIATGLTAALPQIQQIPGLPAAALAEIEKYLAIIQADAVKVAAAVASPPPGTVQEIAQVVQALAAVALPLLPAGSVAEAAIQAAISLLPVILAAIGVAGAGVPARYAPADARAILAAVAA